MNKTFKTSPVGLLEHQPESPWIKDVWNGAVCRLDRIYKGLWQEDMVFQSGSPVLSVTKIKEAKSDYFIHGSLSSTNWARVPGNDLLNHYPHIFKILIAAYASSLASSLWGKKNTRVCLLFSGFTALLHPAVCLLCLFLSHSIAWIFAWHVCCNNHTILSLLNVVTQFYPWKIISPDSPNPPIFS